MPSFLTAARYFPQGRVRRLAAALAAIVLASTGVVSPTLRAAQASDLAVKAAFVVNFLKFVEWPPESAAAGSPLVIAIVGHDPLVAALKDGTAGLLVGGRSIRVRTVRGPGELDGAHVVFITAAEQRQLPAILRRLDGRSVLTVGDTDGFGTSGVVLNMVVQDNRVRVEANTGAAARARLKVSAHLLRLARIVG